MSCNGRQTFVNEKAAIPFEVNVSKKPVDNPEMGAYCKATKREKIALITTLDFKDKQFDISPIRRRPAALKKTRPFWFVPGAMPKRTKTPQKITQPKPTYSKN